MRNLDQRQSETAVFSAYLKMSGRGRIAKDSKEDESAVVRSQVSSRTNELVAVAVLLTNPCRPHAKVNHRLENLQLRDFGLDSPKPTLQSDL